MPARPFELPSDLRILSDIIGPSFQYPENEAWSLQEDEKKGMIDLINRLQKLWPLFQVFQLFSPGMKDLIRGFLWEEDGTPAGISMFQRIGKSRSWGISTVAVLPNFRRRGIARSLVEQTLSSIRQLDGMIVMLDVISGNLPAYALYEKLGFKHYTGNSEWVYESDELLDSLPLPGEAKLEPFSFFDWETRFELEKRILPDAVQEFEPLEVQRFQQPAYLRLLVPLIRLAEGTKEEHFLVRSGEGKVVGRVMSIAHKRGGGIHSLSIRLDPSAADLAPCLVPHLVNRLLESYPKHRVEVIIPDWQPHLPAAIEQAGFRKRKEYHRMGLKV